MAHWPASGPHAHCPWWGPSEDIGNCCPDAQAATREPEAEGYLCEGDENRSHGADSTHRVEN